MPKGLGHWYVEIEKQAYWRAKQHTFVDRYILSGADPTTANASSIIDELKTIESTVFPTVAAGAGVGFVEGRAYGAAGGAPFAVVEYNHSLTPTTATGFSGPSSAYASLKFYGTLENVLEVRTLMAGLSAGGKPVYCRKLFRGIIADGEALTGGTINTGDLATIASTCLAWKTGLGSIGAVVIGTSGRMMQGNPTALSSIANRQVPRGKKKTSRAKAVAFAGASAFGTGYIAGSTAQPASTTTETGSGNTSILSGNTFPIFP